MSEIQSNCPFKRVEGRLLVQNPYFTEGDGLRKGIHFYKYEFWAKILTLFNRAIRFDYMDVEKANE
ncbi:MAG: hypothetical protein HWD61_02410 [Parachlamydiaceae bacterium]|nr:MAG: hypothetical protein HWD61_02410 [Parachlamydiaceae bacterium]